MLHAGIPLPYVRRVDMRRQKDLRIQQREGYILGRWRERVRIASRHVAPRIAELIRAAGIGNLGAEGWVLSDHAVRNECTYRVVHKRSGDANGRPAFAV